MNCKDCVFYLRQYRRCMCTCIVPMSRPGHAQFIRLSRKYHKPYHYSGDDYTHAGTYMPGSKCNCSCGGNACKLELYMQNIVAKDM